MQQAKRHARKQTIPNKLYFRIGEVSDLVQVKPYVLRYWETEFSDIRPTKSKSGQRLYKRRDVELLLQVKTLLYEERYTIDGAKQRLRDNARGGGEVQPAAAAPAPIAATPAPVPANEAHVDEDQLTLDDVHVADDDVADEPAMEMPVGAPPHMRAREQVAARRLLLRLKQDIQDILQNLSS